MIWALVFLLMRTSSRSIDACTLVSQARRAASGAVRPPGCARIAASLGATSPPPGGVAGATVAGAAAPVSAPGFVAAGFGPGACAMAGTVKHNQIGIPRNNAARATAEH